MTVFSAHPTKDDYHPRLGGEDCADSTIDRIAVKAGEVDMGEAIIRQHHNSCLQQKAPSPWRPQCPRVRSAISFRIIQQRANEEILTGYPAIPK